jgi:hypothetical protein
MKILRSRKAISSIEVVTVVILVLAAFLSFGGYLQRAMAGRWRATGDAYGQGRQYDPRGFGAIGENGGTMDCYFDQITNTWIDESLYRSNNCDCTGLRADGVPLPEYAANCTGCKASSRCARPPV